jgi:uncharacterized membrane protein YfcA
MEELIYLPILLLAAFIHGALGFGFPLVSTPLLVLFMELPAAILLTLVPTVSINLVSFFTEKHWRQALLDFWPIPTFTIVGSMLGTQILLSVDPSPFRMLLALVLVAYLATERLTGSKKEHRLPKWGMALFGFGLGLLAGVVNIFAPVLVVYALYTRMNPLLMVATFNMSFLTSKSGQIIGFIANGAFEKDVVLLTVAMVPLVLLSLWVGIRLRRNINQESYTRLLRGALWLIAVALVADWFANG